MSEHKWEGDLRAWLDGELGPSESESVGAHLQECAVCASLRDELSTRASRVASAMSVLSELDIPEARPLPEFAPVIVPMPARAAWAAGAAMAAGLAVAAFLLPKYQGRPTLVVAPTVAPMVSRRIPTMPVTVAVARPSKRHVSASPKPKPTASAPEMFLALDDDPIESGIVVRVSSESGDLQADVIVGPDGRAHAIRILNGASDF